MRLKFKTHIFKNSLSSDSPHEKSKNAIMSDGKDDDDKNRKLEKRIKQLEKLLDEKDSTIEQLEAELEEQRAEKKKSHYSVIQSVGSTFLDRKKKKGKSYFNKATR